LVGSFLLWGKGLLWGKRMLTSLQNPLVKQIRKLQKAKERREQGLFLLEGSHLLTEAVAVGLPLTTVCCTESWQERYPQLFEALMQTAPRLELVSPEVVAAMSTTVQPDGVVAIAPRQHQGNVEFKDLGLVLETIQDPGNLGTMIRTACAVGVDGLLLSADCVDLDNPKVLRASAGQWLRLPMATSRDLVKDLGQIKAQGMQVVATLPSATQTYWEVDLRRPSLIVMGNEGAGLSPAVAALADQVVTIPLAVGVESLNVAIAAALMLYEAKRQRSMG
jgi:RNA methyltransferase, TrmH family